MPFGPPLESFALSELARQTTWSEELVELYHYLYTDTTTLPFGPKLRAMARSAIRQLSGSS